MASPSENKLHSATEQDEYDGNKSFQVDTGCFALISPPLCFGKRASSFPWGTPSRNVDVAALPSSASPPDQAEHAAQAWLVESPFPTHGD